MDKNALSLALPCVDCQTPPPNAVASSSPRTRGGGFPSRFYGSCSVFYSRESSGGATKDILLRAAVPSSAIPIEKQTLHPAVREYSHEKHTRTSDTSVKKTLGHSTRKQQNLLRGTIFSNLSNKVAPQGRHESCCRFGTLH